MEGQAGGARAGGAHAGLDHARALGNAAESHGLSTELEFNRDLLGLRVAGHDRLRGVMRGSGGIIQFLDDLPDAGPNIRHGQLQPNPPRAAHEYIRRLQQQFFGK